MLGPSCRSPPLAELSCTSGLHLKPHRCIQNPSTCHASPSLSEIPWSAFGLSLCHLNTSITLQLHRGNRQNPVFNSSQEGLPCDHVLPPSLLSSPTTICHTHSAQTHFLVVCFFQACQTSPLQGFCRGCCLPGTLFSRLFLPPLHPADRHLDITTYMRLICHPV